jgi:hypothetical protein
MIAGVENGLPVVALVIDVVNIICCEFHKFAPGRVRRGPSDPVVSYCSVQNSSK